MKLRTWYEESDTNLLNSMDRAELEPSSDRRVMLNLYGPLWGKLEGGIAAQLVFRDAAELRNLRDTLTRYLDELIPKDVERIPNDQTIFSIFGD